MINLNSIEKLHKNHAWLRIVRRILDNGRLPSVSPGLLTHPSVVQHAALALSLQRFTELSHGIHPAIPSILKHLLAIQRPDGLFARFPSESDLFSALDNLERERRLNLLRQAAGVDEPSLPCAHQDRRARAVQPIEDHHELVCALSSTAVAAAALFLVLDNSEQFEATGINPAQVRTSLESAIDALMRNFKHLSASERRSVYLLLDPQIAHLADSPRCAELSEVVAVSPPISRPPSPRTRRPRRSNRLSAAA